MAYSAPRGTVDLLPQQTKNWQYLEQLLRTIAFNYNVKEIRVPIFEHTELFNRAVGDTTDVVSKEMYTFKDRGDRSLTLRPEGTAGVVRAFVENKLYVNPDKLTKLYYMGPMFRYERPQKGRQRQFHQFGVEMLGLENPEVDVECMVMAVTIIESLGLQNVKLHINTLGDETSRENYRQALMNHFKPGLNELCGDCQARFEKNPLRILDCKVDKAHPLIKTAPKTIDYLTLEAKAHFEKVCALLDDLEIDYLVDTNLVRGLDYYCHTVFEVISEDPTFGNAATLGGGGRYNKLVQEMGGPETPGVGFAFGMERLALALDQMEPEEEDALDIYIMPLGQEARDLSLQIVTMLRANGFSCDMDYANRSMKAMFKTVDRLQAHFAIIIGEEEVKNEVVNIKCTHDKVQETVPLEDIVAYIEHHLEGGHEHE
ncbi:histidine--tRNA ligase [Beduini massiliensis]|uniref:histidine--tRNA ligase n=1 Tax=Beduini massiliensis TaxID=1585974 RepID=UPI00059A93C2|nr:histidine--tRNA ligase [Beduini massiliensis]